MKANGCMLLVDDEDPVLHLCRKIFKKSNFLERATLSSPTASSSFTDSSLDIALNHGRSSESNKLDGCGLLFLRSFGLERQQIELLLEFHSHGYPEVKSLAYELGMEPHTVTMRLSRIKRKLGLQNMNQVTQLMTILSVFTHCRRKMA
jgi:hypothetical protein